MFCIKNERTKLAMAASTRTSTPSNQQREKLELLQLLHCAVLPIQPAPSAPFLMASQAKPSLVPTQQLCALPNQFRPLQARPLLVTSDDKAAAVAAALMVKKPPIEQKMGLLSQVIHPQQDVSCPLADRTLPITSMNGSFQLSQLHNVATPRRYEERLRQLHLLLGALDSRNGCAPSAA